MVVFKTGGFGGWRGGVSTGRDAGPFVCGAVSPPVFTIGAGELLFPGATFLTERIQNDIR